MLQGTTMRPELIMLMKKMQEDNSERNWSDTDIDARIFASKVIIAVCIISLIIMLCVGVIK